MVDQQNDSTVAGMMGLEDKDVDNMQKLLPFLMPISPWLGLGLGGAMGLYSYYKAKEDMPRQREHNAKLAELAHLTEMKPSQTYFQEPSLVGHMLGGLQGGMGVADSINAYGPAFALQQYVSDLNADTAAARKQRVENQDILGRGAGPLSNQGVAEYDATLAASKGPNTYPQPSIYDGYGRTPEYRGQWPSPYTYMEPATPSRPGLLDHQYGPPEYVDRTPQNAPLPVLLGE